MAVIGILMILIPNYLTVKNSTASLGSEEISSKELIELLDLSKSY